MLFKYEQSCQPLVSWKQYTQVHTHTHTYTHTTTESSQKNKPDKDWLVTYFFIQVLLLWDFLGRQKESRSSFNVRLWQKKRKTNVLFSLSFHTYHCMDCFHACVQTTRISCCSSSADTHTWILRVSSGRGGDGRSAVAQVLDCVPLGWTVAWSLVNGLNAGCCGVISAEQEMLHV